MAIYPYGENGITNSLLECFDQDNEFFSHCIEELTQWTDGEEREFQHTDLQPEFIIQQPGFGRRGFGEPDGLVKANRYAFYLEAKALSYWQTFGADWANFIKLNKYFAIASAIRQMNGDEIVLEKEVIEVDEDGGYYVDTRRFRIGARPEIIQNLYGELRNNQFYIIILTKNEAQDWPGIGEHYRAQIEMYDQHLNHDDHYECRFGWMPLVDIWNEIQERDEEYFQKLSNAFQCNGF
jgi:hypothetical protein